MRESPRCGAKTPKNALSGSRRARKKRCRMHGGAKGSGAPIGNQNALTHGLSTAESKAFNKHIQEILRRGKETLRKV
jgi:uncharacterized protein YjcR